MADKTNQTTASPGRWARFARKAVPICFVVSVLSTLYVAASFFFGAFPPYLDMPGLGAAIIIAAISSLLEIPLLLSAPGKPRTPFWFALPLALLWGLALLLAPALIAGAGSGAAFPG